MDKMKRLIPCLLGLLLLVSCGRKTVINEEHTFDGNIWNRFTPEEFKLSVDNIENYYHIDLTRLNHFLL